MNIAIIDIGWCELTVDSLKKKALGGSETWLMQISQEFAKDSKVTVFCNTPEEQERDNLKFIPLKSIIRYFNINRPHYDFVILNRIIHRYKTDFIGLIRQYNVTENIYIQMHDLSLLYDDHLATESELRSSCLFDKRVRGFVFLTPWHANNFFRQYPSLRTCGIIVPNGVDTSLLPKQEQMRDNRILWSSCIERGLDILVDDIYPLVKKEISDFGIDVAGYNDLSSVDIQDKDIRILGNLTKEELYNEMSKHKAWFYPGIFAETFCITMVENALNKVNIISPFTYGTDNILPNGLRNSKLKHTFFNRDSEEYKAACEEAAKHIVNTMQHYDEINKYLDVIKEHCMRYNWFNAVDRYKQYFNNDTYKYPVKKKLKGIFLSQSCNNDFFKRESELVEQSWAKELIEGKHPGYEYFRYTACDADHPLPCIDEHIIYVNNDDTLYQTYEKMRSAYRLLLTEGYDFDYIFRTNTSTFVNVPLAIKAIETASSNQVVSDICGYYIKMPNGELNFQFNTFTGNAYIMSKQVADRIFTSNFDSTISSIPDGDDIITARIIDEIFNDNTIQFVALNVDPETKQGTLCKRYKFTDLSTDNDKEHKERYTDNPNVVKQYVTTSYRYNSLDFKEREIEFEHLLELYHSYIQ